jgi:hypothetical protein
MVTSPKGLGPEKDCPGEGQQRIQKIDSSSRQRGRPTKRLTVSRNVSLTLTIRLGGPPRKDEQGSHKPPFIFFSSKKKKGRGSCKAVTCILEVFGSNLGYESDTPTEVYDHFLRSHLQFIMPL